MPRVCSLGRTGAQGCRRPRSRRRKTCLWDLLGSVYYVLSALNAAGARGVSKDTMLPPNNFWFARPLCWWHNSCHILLILIYLQFDVQNNDNNILNNQQPELNPINTPSTVNKSSTTPSPQLLDKLRRVRKRSAMANPTFFCSPLSTSIATLEKAYRCDEKSSAEFLRNYLNILYLFLSLCGGTISTYQLTIATSTGFRRRSGRRWCSAKSGSTGFRRSFRRRFREALVQSQVKVPEKVWEALVQSQVRFNRICCNLIRGNPAEVFPALGFAARFRKICKNKPLRLLGIPRKLIFFINYSKLESRRRRTKGSVVGEEWCQNAAPLRWYTKNFFAQSKMILSRAWLHDTVSCAAWNDARKGVYLKPLFKTPCSNCYWGWSKPIMLDYRDISLMESVPLMWGPVTASPVGIEPMTIFGISNT